MAQIYKCKTFRMEDEVKTYKRYLKLPKKIAFSKDWDKQRRIIDPSYDRADYSNFNYENSKDILKDDFEVFKEHANFDVESLESEKIRENIKVNLLSEMLRKKPHYAKYFPDLEEEFESHK